MCSDHVGVGDTTRVHVRVDVTECQVAEECVGVDQHQIAVFLVSVGVFVETVAHCQAGVAVACCVLRISCDIDVAQLVTCGGDCANVGRLGQTTIRVIIASAKYVDLEHFDTVGNAFGCVLRLATYDQVATFATTACLVQVDVDCDRIVDNLLAGGAEVTVNVITADLLFNTREAGCNKLCTVAGHNRDTRDIVRFVAVIVKGCVNLSRVEEQQRTRWHEAGVDRSLEGRLQSRNEAFMCAGSVCRVSFDHNFCDSAVSIKYVEDDTINVDVVEAVRIVQTFRFFVEQEVDDFTFRLLTGQQVIVVEVDRQVGCVVIAVEVVGVIHANSDCVGVARSTTRSQRCHVFDDQIAVRVVRAQLFMIGDVLRIHDDIEGIIVVVRVITTHKYAVVAIIRRVRGTKIARFEIDFFDVGNTWLDVGSTSTASGRTQELKRQLCVKTVITACTVKTLCRRQGVGNTTSKRVLLEVAQELVIVVCAGHDICRGRQEVCFAVNNRCCGVEERVDVCFCRCHGALVGGHAFDDRLRARLCGRAVSVRCLFVQAGRVSRVGPCNSNVDLVHHGCDVVALCTLNDGEDDFADGQRAFVTVDGGDQSVAPECQTIHFTFGNIIRAFRRAVEEVQVNFCDECVGFFNGWVTQERVSSQRFSLSGKEARVLCEADVRIFERSHPECFAERIGCTVIITDINRCNLLLSCQRA